MSEPKQPLEIFLIRSYFKKTSPNLVGAPSSCNGIEICQQKDYTSTVPPGLSSLCYYSLVPGVVKGCDPMLHLLVRQPRDPDFPMRIELTSEFLDGQYIYSLSTMEIGLPATHHQLRCNQPWDFMQQLLSNYRSKYLGDISETKLATQLAEHRQPFSIVLEGDFNIYRDVLGTHYRLSSSTELFECPRLALQYSWFKSQESSDLDIPQNLLRFHLAEAYAIRRLPVIRKKLEDLKNIQSESERRFHFEWVYRGHLLRFAEFYYWAVLPIRADVAENVELADLLENIFSVSLPGLYPESIEYEKMSVDSRISKLVATLPAHEQMGTKLTETYVFTEALQKLPTYLEKVGFRLQKQMKHMRSEASKSEREKLKEEIKSRCMFWRFAFDYNGSCDILTEYIRNLLPFYKVVSLPSKRVIWGGKWQPLQIVKFGQFIVAVYAGFISWAPADSSEEYLSDDSKWDRLSDPLYSEGAQVIKLGNQSAALVSQGSIFLANFITVVQIDLNPLVKKQRPIYTDLFKDSNYKSATCLYATSKFIAAIDQDTKQIVVRNNLQSNKEFVPFKITDIDPIKVKAKELDEKDAKALRAPQTRHVWGTSIFLEQGNNPHMLLLFASSSFFKSSALIALKVANRPHAAVRERISLKYTSHVEMSTYCEHFVFFEHRGLIITLNLDLGYFRNNGWVAVMRRGKLSVIQAPEAFAIGKYTLPIHHSQNEFIHFNPKRQSVVFHSSRGRYGEGYTISVHPLKLLLN